MKIFACLIPSTIDARRCGPVGRRRHREPRQSCYDRICNLQGLHRKVFPMKPDLLVVPAAGSPVVRPGAEQSQVIICNALHGSFLSGQGGNDFTAAYICRLPLPDMCITPRCTLRSKRVDGSLAPCARRSRWSSASARRRPSGKRTLHVSFEYRPGLHKFPIDLELNRDLFAMRNSVVQGVCNR